MPSLVSTAPIRASWKVGKQNVSGAKKAYVYKLDRISDKEIGQSIINNWKQGGKIRFPITWNWQLKGKAPWYVPLFIKGGKFDLAFLKTKGKEKWLSGFPVEKLQIGAITGDWSDLIPTIFSKSKKGIGAIKGKKTGRPDNIKDTNLYVLSLADNPENIGDTPLGLMVSREKDDVISIDTFEVNPRHRKKGKKKEGEESFKGIMETLLYSVTKDKGKPIEMDAVSDRVARYYKAIIDRHAGKGIAEKVNNQQTVKRKNLKVSLPELNTFHDNMTKRLSRLKKEIID